MLVCVGGRRYLLKPRGHWGASRAQRGRDPSQSQCLPFLTWWRMCRTRWNSRCSSCQTTQIAKSLGFQKVAMSVLVFPGSSEDQNSSQIHCWNGHNSLQPVSIWRGKHFLTVGQEKLLAFRFSHYSFKVCEFQWEMQSVIADLRFSRHASYSNAAALH